MLIWSDHISLGFDISPGVTPIRGCGEDEGGVRVLQRDDHQRPRGRLRHRRVPPLHLLQQNPKPADLTRMQQSHDDHSNHDDDDNNDKESFVNFSASTDS